MKKRLYLDDKDVVGNPVCHYARFSIYLFIFWLLISGSLHLKFLIIGIIASLTVAWVCTPLFMIRNQSQTKKYFALAVPLPGLAVYLIWLLKELILSNIDVAKAVLKKSLPITPEVIRFQVKYDNPLAITLLANSITLTPGTLTLNVTADGIFEIHSLTPAASEGIKSGSMAKKVARLLREPDYFTVISEGGTLCTPST
ncbi:Multiple resistance and pH homeostasis protein E [uncultured Roseburia sp.]|uniref:Na+/H+ antiporter subunit E n=1 Tax=Brotonthovivens ammoniilytica TaxID=2981725 RepID=A0ABT2TLN9_9FIRM|nr:Na+/H+ antiporter subunit E [Brotonthovivens ammoniilytica]MCU6763130.1 Na+/H+ antiporter subunit E [Brotonthovivens ammoniilytica]SCJ04215.1 Multiple resistance and pH homeostasis protein E [uncultured Roseburia sp.]